MKSLLLIIILFIPTNAHSSTCDAMYGGVRENISEYQLCREYAIGYDSDLRSAVWVAYTVSELTLMHIVKRKGSFRADRKLKHKDRIYSSWYIHSGYDRGHMAPAADFRYSGVAEANTFIMSNAVPQLPGVNRGIWKTIEIRVRKSVHKYGMVMVFTGPIYGIDVLKINGKINIPASFYKIILRTYPREAIAFIIPNKKPPKGYKLKDYTVTIDQVEARTKINFFSDYVGRKQAKLESIGSMKSDWPIILK